MVKIQSWSGIIAKYDGQWVELIDYDWDWDSPFPRWARVRNHSFSRFELSKMVNRSEKVPNSITLFLGAVESAIDWSDAVGAM